jgi:cell division protein FtsL
MAAPPPASAARKLVASSSRPSQKPGRGAPRHAPLKVVPTRRLRMFGGERLLMLLSVALIVSALLVVVAGQALLANGQVRMAALQHQVSTAKTAVQASLLRVAILENPDRITKAALGSGMVHSPYVELPNVPLTKALPTPTVSPAPAAASATTANTSTP